MTKDELKEIYRRGYEAGHRGDCFANHDVETSKMNQSKRKAFCQGFLDGQLDRTRGK